MSKIKLISGVFLIVSVIIGFIVTIKLMLADDLTQIEEQVNSLNQGPYILHTEFIENDHAIVFYQWGTILHHRKLAFMELEKTQFTWEFKSAHATHISREDRLEAQLTELGDKSVLRGRVDNADIEDITILSTSGHTYSGTLIEDDNGRKYWFFIGEDDDFTEATITGLSKSGEVIEEITAVKSIYR
ncbi:hypothetical protein MM221_10500 [Salipaludibacillus sp. LMS25]|jgi:hypothetical protein|uniref:hypothetical protein n=1 Tax=Salipaludibacillus sp. LMS25 TaxID=2924031 RepID=UPI0020D019B6|nr:hypothetical protein [Salipaludibacillus sp. LMS25]UTR16898.1 hypothetical protein MM221_10500 [Salipaludibacillus sp. LMS25]